MDNHGDYINKIAVKSICIVEIKNDEVKDSTNISDTNRKLMMIIILKEYQKWTLILKRGNI